MKKALLISLLIAVFCAFNIATDALADPDPYSLEQETYLLQKVDEGSDPWTIILPDSDNETIAFGKLEYFNYAVDGGFSFDFKGYDFGLDEENGDQNMLADDEYALIYYVDKAVGWQGGPPPVYVLGISTGPYVPTSRGEAKGLEGVDIKICGSCGNSDVDSDKNIAQIPDENDVNYPNGGKIWLVPASYLVEPEACHWTTWNGWPAGGAGILFETSLITYGFEPQCYPDLPSPDLIYTGSEDYVIDSTEYTRYKLEVTNSVDFPDELFVPSPHLPPCGLNTDASRTWVDIYDNNDARLYGFCALSCSDDLNLIWFAKPKGTPPPASVYITLHDRECDITYTSNLVVIEP